MLVDLGKIAGFDRDDGNSRKSLDKHGVTQREAEHVFFSARLAIVPDLAHAADEDRFHAFGQTAQGRRLQVSFTLRGNAGLIRVISARDMSRYERRRYEEVSEEG